MYDIIGDIHGYAGPLKKLLEKLGYIETDGTWHHLHSKVIFVGDYIDRGPAIRETLQIVKGMADNGNAIALMGNHEYNAMAYHYETPQGFLRKHDEKNIKQHELTIEQFRGHENEWEMYLKWFYTLPLFFEDKGIRVVHACWDEDQIHWLKNNCESIQVLFNQKVHRTCVLDVGLLMASRKKDSVEYHVINDILKGKEFNIPEEYEWSDCQGLPRKSNRIKWWVDPHSAVYDEWLFDCPAEMKSLGIDGSINTNIYPKTSPAVFFGHYWLEDSCPTILDKNIVCLDYSIANKGSLVGYRWVPGQQLDITNFVKVTNGKLISLSPGS
jgi:hypothetical protein